MTDCSDNAFVPDVADRDYERYTSRPLCGPRDANPSRLSANRPLPPQTTLQSNSLRATALLSLTLGAFFLSYANCQAPAAGGDDTEVGGREGARCAVACSLAGGVMSPAGTRGCVSRIRTGCATMLAP